MMNRINRVGPCRKSTPLIEVEVVLSSTRVMSTRRMPCLPSSVNQVRIHIYCVMFSSCNELFFRFVSTHHRHQLSLFLNLNFSDSRPIVLFDGECNLCNKFVQTLLKYDSCDNDIRGNLRFAALQSHVGKLLMSVPERGNFLFVYRSAPYMNGSPNIYGAVPIYVWAHPFTFS